MAGLTWMRLAYARTDPRNRHGAWHLCWAVNDPSRFRCGDQYDTTRAYQEITMDTRPPGIACLVCLRKAGYTVDRAPAKRRRRR